MRVYLYHSEPMQVSNADRVFREAADDQYRLSPLASSPSPSPLNLLPVPTPRKRSKTRFCGVSHFPQLAMFERLEAILIRGSARP